MWWIILVLIYGILKGIRDIAKKKALTLNGVVEVLFVYTLLAFIFTVPTSGNVLGVPGRDMWIIAFKSFIIFIAFLASFYAIEKMPVSLYGVIDLSRMLFAMILGVFVLGEVLRPNQYIAIVLVSAGLLLLKCKPKYAFLRKLLGKGKAKASGAAKNGSDLNESAEINKCHHENMDGITAVEASVPVSDRIPLYIFILAFVSTFLNAVSGMLDKILMRTGNITSGQLQFWYMLFMVIYYGIYVLITRTKINWKSIMCNKYVWVISILFVIADRCLFVANGIAGSRVTVMTLLKQVCCIVTIVGGKLIFKEKDTLHRFICAAIVITGIVFSVL